MNKLHFIYIPFRGVGLDFGDDAWFEKRIDIFRKHTLESLKNQTNKDFIVWISLRPEDKNTYLYKLLSRIMEKSGLRYVITFDGLMYWDDKFGRKDIIKNILRVIKRAIRIRSSKNIIPAVTKILFSKKNKSLVQRVDNSLSFLASYNNGGMVYMTRLDSDDMLEPEFISKTQEIGSVEAIVVENGYVYNAKTGEKSYWRPKTNPPFHTLIFPNDVFFSGRKHVSFYKDFRSHEDITRIFRYYTLPDNLYCVVTHDSSNHISTTWNHPFRYEK